MDGQWAFKLAAKILVVMFMSYITGLVFDLQIWLLISVFC